MARGAIIVLVGTTFSVVGEALDFFAKRFGDRPSCVYLVPTAQTFPYARLAQLAIIDRFKGQPPVVRIRPVMVSDITTENDFLQFVEHLSSVYAEVLDSCVRDDRGPIVASITGGRKTMSVAGAIVFSHLGADVIDTRSRTAEEDRALYSQIARMLREGATPEEIYSLNKDAIAALTFRPADVSYVLPRFRLDLDKSDARLSEALRVI